MVGLETQKLAAGETDGHEAIPRLAFGSWAFAFGPYSSDPWSFSRVCSFVAEAGYDGIEINGFRPHPHPDDFDSDAKCSELLKEITDFGLGISGYAPDMTKTPPASVPEASYLANLDSAIRFCNRMGITTLRVDSVEAPNEYQASEYEARFARLASTFRSAARRSAESGVRLVWEFEPGFWLNKPSEVLRVIEAVGDDNFSVLFDTSHALTSAVGRRQPGNPEILPGGEVQYAELLAPHVGHLHLIDSVGELHNGETSEHLPFGTGTVDFDSVITALGNSATDLEWWTVDFCFWPHTERDGVEGSKFVRDLAARHRHA